MKNYRVELLPEAQSDLIKTLDYIATELCAPLAALHLHEAIMAEFQTLKTFPLSGTEVKNNFPLHNAYRWVMVENYMIFYTVDENSEVVYIARILFSSSDYQLILS